MSGNERRFPSPLRYPGGKGKIANYIKLLLLENDLVGCEYFELYAGGSGVALSLLYEGLVSRVHINDIDVSVHAFWRAAIHDTEALCRRIQDTRVSVAEWRRQRAVQEAPDPDRLDLAFSTFFLNRTNRSGILRGGVIGGFKQTGNYGIDARFNKRALIERIEKVGRHRGRITLTQLDAAMYLRGKAAALPKLALLYLDPPYFGQGERLYLNAYGPRDHAEIARLIKKVRRPWVVSYDAEPSITKLYEGLPMTRYGIHYSAADHYKGREVMFFSPRITRPQRRTPTEVSFADVDDARLAGVA